MRVALTLILLATLMSGPTFAQWEGRPAPQSWGQPQYALPVAPVLRGERPPAQLPASQPLTLQDAVICSAALQLATMAAPNWAQERGIIDMTNAWLQKVFVLGETSGVGGDKIPGLVEVEMQRQTDGAVTDPAGLSRRAFDCASRQP